MTAAIPLRSPDGVTYAYACGSCHKLRALGEYLADVNDAEAIARLAASSLRQADGCCRCRGCDAPNVHGRSAFCATCQPIEGARMDAVVAAAHANQLARNAARDASLLKAADVTAANALAEAMSDISEESYCAGWMSGLEVDLWSMVEGGARGYGLGEVSVEDVARLTDLSAKAGGWWVFERFIPIDEWRAAYAKHVAGGGTS